MKMVWLYEKEAIHQLHRPRRGPARVSFHRKLLLEWILVNPSEWGSKQILQQSVLLSDIKVLERQ